MTTPVGPAVHHFLNAYVSEADLAATLGIHTRSLRRWHDRGRGPARTKIGRQIWYSKKAVEQFLAQCEQSGRRRVR